MVFLTKFPISELFGVNSIASSKSKEGGTVGSFSTGCSASIDNS